MAKDPKLEDKRRRAREATRRYRARLQGEPVPKLKTGRPRIDDGPPAASTADVPPDAPTDPAGAEAAALPSALERLKRAASMGEFRIAFIGTAEGAARWVVTAADGSRLLKTALGDEAAEFLAELEGLPHVWHWPDAPHLSRLHPQLVEVFTSAHAAYRRQGIQTPAWMWLGEYVRQLVAAAVENDPENKQRYWAMGDEWEEVFDQWDAAVDEEVRAELAESGETLDDAAEYLAEEEPHG